MSRDDEPLPNGLEHDRSSSSSNSAGRRRLRTYSVANQTMPWFGMDIGGTLTKLVYFEPSDQEEFDFDVMGDERQRIAVIHKFLMKKRTYGETGIRDEHLQLENACINGRRGTLHFIRFATNRVDAFIEFTKSKSFADLQTTVCATGGGAFKFAHHVEEALGMKLHKFDELETVLIGIRYIAKWSSREVFYWEGPISAFDDDQAKRIDYDEELHYPYLVVNCGSGVSVLLVRSKTEYKRVSGTSIGGGFFAGICSLLTSCTSFEQAIELATQGDNTKVDKLVRDIYGGDYDLFGLPGDTVAASFGQMIDPEKRKQATPADLCRAALVTVANNVGGISFNAARQENVTRVLFVGNFLRVNPIASRRLAYAMEYWSEGKIKALFLRHEGYFGAVGCLLKLTEQNDIRRERERRSRDNLQNN